MKRYYNAGRNTEWSLSDSEIAKIIDDVNSIYYYKLKQLQEFYKPNAKKVKKLITKRNKMVIKRIETCLKRKKAEIVKSNLTQLKLYK